jgi:hypothetical protein
MKKRCLNYWEYWEYLPTFALPKKGIFVGGIAPASYKTEKS